jgi:hypothetical protein
VSKNTDLVSEKSQILSFRRCICKHHWLQTHLMVCKVMKVFHKYLVWDEGKQCLPLPLWSPAHALPHQQNVGWEEGCCQFLASKQSTGYFRFLIWHYLGSTYAVLSLSVNIIWDICQKWRLVALSSGLLISRARWGPGVCIYICTQRRLYYRWSDDWSLDTVLLVAWTLCFLSLWVKEEESFGFLCSYL